LSLTQGHRELKEKPYLPPALLQGNKSGAKQKHEKACEENIPARLRDKSEKKHAAKSHIYLARACEVLEMKK
jgi:hypothetical protein